jgi:hypothetical protein
MELVADTQPLRQSPPRSGAPAKGDGQRHHGERQVVVGTITPRPAAPLAVSGGMAARTSLLTPAADVRLDAHPRVARPVEPRPRSETLSRAVNFTLALIAVVALAPVLALIALAIRLTSPGPVLYTQVRVGQDRRGRRGASSDERRRADYGGRPFTIYKFRSISPSTSSARCAWTPSRTAAPCGRAPTTSA